MVDDDLVPAEVEVVPGEHQRAAAELQRLGFRVLHIGATISITGPASLWRRVFTFPPETPEEPAIPADLAGMVIGIYPAKPPDFFTS